MFDHEKARTEVFANPHATGDFIFTITALAKYPERDRHETRVFGWYPTYAKAAERVDKGSDFEECLYNYIVIERQNSGAYSLAEQIQWFEIDPTRSQWLPISQPEWAERIINWNGF